MAPSTREGADHEDEIRLWWEDEWCVAKDVETGVTTQGTSRAVALENLDEAVALHQGEIRYEPTDVELEELGIDPENNTTGEQYPRTCLNRWEDGRFQDTKLPRSLSMLVASNSSGRPETTHSCTMGIQRTKMVAAR